MDSKEFTRAYEALQKEKMSINNALAFSPDGYISEKTISGKKYYYLQRRISGKVKSEYISENNVHKIREQLNNRKAMLVRNFEIDEELSKIEAAAKILDDALYRKIVVIKRCYLMDSTPISDRAKALSFANAMTALEGIPVSDATNRNLQLWADGKQSYMNSYFDTLVKYNLIEV